MQLPVKPEPMQVEVLSGELSCSRRKEASTSQPRGQGVNHGVSEQASRNEGEPHPMSPERLTTGQPSLFNPGEGCQEVPNDKRRQGISSVRRGRRGRRAWKGHWAKQGDLPARGRPRLNPLCKLAQPARQPGRGEKSESLVVVSIQRRTNALGSEGAALGHTRPKAAKDRAMAGWRGNTSLIGYKRLQSSEVAAGALAEGKGSSAEGQPLKSPRKAGRGKSARPV